MDDSTPYDALIVGGGPAGLSAALNLGRALMRVLLVDADRPRNAATLNSHGFLTRDGVPPHELRRLARAELEAYPGVEVRSRVRVHSLRMSDAGFDAGIGRRAPDETVATRAVLLATGLRETLPDVPNLRGFYGMSLFSCTACDAWELQGRRLALIGETSDLAARARLIARWTAALTVFTNGSDAVTAAEEAELTAAGVTVRRARIAELVGDRGIIEAVRLDDGEAVSIEGGFVRPEWSSDLSFLHGTAPSVDGHGLIRVDHGGRTDIAGLYAAGDATVPGPQQLIVAAGAGAQAARSIVRDSVGVAFAH
ncbi:NAD(P)/FAD-dependent oxidoreductase [Microbacterium sp. GCS4]|uniref:NAD(P)/FAD-dependent oxidoreductase n=1 Tax=Microbacterium sp. GCS4 TaxID=1692239 RepID=UPI0006831D91|nr:NAD(P)/FAD-dependent oxidoreductase [Microbacterium sp. GCS4]KNY04002.1 pyridine nucleotide-disulfide oxidoreductase [Microbacterium sp. GCS4]